MGKGGRIYHQYEVSEYVEMRHYTMTQFPWVDTGYVRLIESITGVQWEPEGPPFKWTTRLVEFPTEGLARGLGFSCYH